MSEEVVLQSTAYWVKIVGMLQQNWALIEEGLSGTVVVYFVTDASGVFDEIGFEGAEDAERALERNGFRLFAISPDLQSFLAPPSPPFHRTTHPNGPIYSSGRYWR